jgi:hypothetical protein
MPDTRFSSINRNVVRRIRGFRTVSEYRHLLRVAVVDGCGLKSVPRRTAALLSLIICSPGRSRYSSKDFVTVIDSTLPGMPELPATPPTIALTPIASVLQSDSEISGTPDGGYAGDSRIVPPVLRALAQTRNSALKMAEARTRLLREPLFNRMPISYPPE